MISGAGVTLSTWEAIGPRRLADGPITGYLNELAPRIFRIAVRNPFGRNCQALDTVLEYFLNFHS